MKRFWLVTATFATVTALGARMLLATSSDEAPAGIPDSRIGLVHQEILAIPAPDEVHENLSEPGERPPDTPWNEAAPPVIPHGIDDFLPITPSNNGCVECHAVQEKIEGEPTPIPESHFRDLRGAPESIREEVAGSRYVCTSCHVAQTDARAIPLDDR